MAELQKANLGTPPSGVGGDDQRAANTRFNANVDVLKAQAAITTAAPITSPQSLTVDKHVGRRVNINLAAPGAINMPRISDLPDQDGVILLRNLGTTAATLAPAVGTSDWIGLSRLNPGEAALMDGYGGAWNVLMRGRARGDHEAVVGDLAVGGTLTVTGGIAGDLAVSGKIAAVNNPNLLFNSTGEFGTAGWGNAFTVAVGGNDIGTFFTNANAITSASVWSGSDSRPIGQNLDMCLSGEIYAGGVITGNVFARMVFLDSTGAVASIGPSITGVPGKGWTFKSVTARSPSNAAKMYVQFGAETVNGSINIQAVGVAWKRIKLEPGTKPSLYSQEASIAYLGGAPAYAGRPTFAGRVPWDSGNLANPMDLDGVQTVTGLKSFTQRISVTKDPVNGAYANAPVCLVAPTGMASFALASKNGASVVQLRCTSDTSALEVVNGSSGAYQPITCYSVTQTSDARLKSDVQTITGALEKLRKLRGVYYVMNGGRGVGVIAQEVGEVFPEVVEELGVSADDGTPYLGVNYANMVGPLLQGMLEIDAALQDAMKRIKALESEK